MRLVLIMALLAALLVAPLTVFAEGNSTIENETEMVDIIEETGNQKGTTAEMALLFGKVHSTLLMATEEAFGYLLFNNESEKQAYIDEITASKEAFAAFEAAASQAGENNSVLVSGNKRALREFENLTITGDAMFASFEKEGTPVLKDVAVFEESVFAIFNASEETWVEFIMGKDVPETADSTVRALYGKLLSAVQESYAYPVLGDTARKEKAIADFSDFDTRVARYAEKYPDTSYDEIIALKEEIQNAAQTMFTTYEKEGKVNGEEAAVLEALVEKMDSDVITLFDKAPSEKSQVNEEILVMNETTEKATA
ncbi:MAG TPA: hypothetical protein VN372_06885 [Methanospirillum sp.]|nr:hypothetical protein [Methanospirillum sp.]